MPDTFVRTRCASCAKVLSFDDFTAGGDRCRSCTGRATPATEFVRGPRIRRPNARTLQARSEENAYERLLDEMPDELVEELVAALEAEAAKLPPSPANPVRGVLSELQLGHSPRERQWAAWGFAAGFAANVALAKYAQMASSAPMGDFVGPLLIGGTVAGACCAAIGWGLAKLREPSNT